MLTLNTKKLGFGLMRLPKIGGKEDIEQTKKMVDYAISHGYCYFDTAYVYDNGLSEMAVNEVLTKRYNRSDFYLATKFPYYAIKSKEDRMPLFNEQLKRTGVKFFDLYLIHAISKDNLSKVDKFDGWEFSKELKEKGLVKHIGFSFHADAELLEQLLIKHPEVEFVQLQINYIDYDDEIIQSKKCLDLCIKYNKPVIVMEPVKGGSLAILREDTAKILQNLDNFSSLASYALRFAANLQNVIMVLSGMSNMEQMIDNINTFNNMTPLSTKEMQAIDDVVKSIKSINTIPCTACKYCVKGCPKNIQIPDIFKCYNDFIKYNDIKAVKMSYSWAIEDAGKASDCVNCKKCEASCPQHIKITEHLKNAAKLLE